MISHSVKPSLSVLNPEQIQQVHAYSLNILEKVGIRVDSKKALDRFTAVKGIIQDGNFIKIMPELVEMALTSVKHSIPIYYRDGRVAFSLGECSARFGVGVTNLFYQEPETNQVVPFKREHMALGTRLGENLPGYDLVSTIGVVKDAPSGLEDLIGTLEMAANTQKPLVLLISDERQFLPVIQMLESLFGNLSEKPFIIPYFNPVTPLVINADTGDKMVAAIEKGLPVIFSNYGMAGTTTPINPAEILALLNAELLSGLVLSQLIKPGSSIILGSLPAFFDMKVMVDFYDPRTILLNAACAEMMDFYKIPHAGTSGSGLGWSMDLQAAGLTWMNHLTACIGKTGLAPFVGGSLGSKAFSPTSVVYANDVILQARWFADGFILDEYSSGMDELLSSFPGRDFLSSKSTRLNYRSAYFQSPIFPHLSLEKWVDLGRPEANRYLVDKTVELISTSKPPDDHDEIIAFGEDYIKKLC